MGGAEGSRPPIRIAKVFEKTGTTAHFCCVEQVMSPIRVYVLWAGLRTLSGFRVCDGRLRGPCTCDGRDSRRGGTPHPLSLFGIATSSSSLLLSSLELSDTNVYEP